ncbi:MAG: thiol reductant ABC exporter subunit CydD [Anaerolineae bacterium]
MDHPRRVFSGVALNPASHPAPLPGSGEPCYNDVHFVRREAFALHAPMANFSEKRLLADHPGARRWMYASVAAAFLAAACVVAFAWILSETVAQVFQQRQNLAAVSPLLVGLAALALARAALLWADTVLGQHSASQLKQALRDQLNRRLFALGPNYTQGERSGELVNTVVEGVEVLDGYVTGYLPARLLAGLVPGMVLLVILLLDAPSAAVLIFTGPVLLLLLALIGGRVREITDRRFYEMSWMSAFFLDMLQGLGTLKMFGRNREQIKNIREISQHHGTTSMEVLRTAFQTGLVLEWGGAVATALVAVEVSLRLMAGGLPFNVALAVLVIVPEFFFPLRQLAIKYHIGTAGKAAAERIYAVLDTPVPASAPAVPYPTPPLRMDIRFEQVSFAYAEGQRPALRELTLHLAQGQTLALVGTTGAGKSTAASLLLRFIAPQQGAITVDGMPLDQIDLAGWRAQVAWVPQRPHLFHGTLADNLRLARPDATDTDLVRAAQAAALHDFIAGLPAGYATSIGEGGARLSGGQRQRLALARAFLRDARLVILDEATANLDPASESAIQNALAQLRQDRTVLIIAHRLRLAYTADRVAVLEQGRVIEVGDPVTLLSAAGPYQELVASYEEGAA